MEKNLLTMTTSINKYMLAAMVVAMAACSSPDITENTVGTPLRKCTLEVEPVSRLVFNTDADGNPLTNLVWSPDDMITIVDDETGTQTMSRPFRGYDTRREGARCSSLYQ